ncbi:response regulator [Flavobacterium sp.]|uniref:response regulator n=1 Tax=Flavobacterium sp. TaxID=239 RepID=UPI000E8077E9|nr:response regulator [Flavobacterium sp.]HBD26182.1 response regulator [Flavobacterium sp.]
MNKTDLHILMIDDHPSMIEGYKSILSFNDLGLRITTTPAYNCESAYNIIDNTPVFKAFDFAFVDLSLPPYLEKNIKSGEDLALLIKNKFPDCKIVILTSHAEAFILDAIQKNIAPNGLLVKSDFTADEFLLAFEKIYNNHFYTSRTVVENIAELHEKSAFLDENNRKLITLLAEGVKTKNLPQRMNLSISAIDKRKAQIKYFFKIEKGSDEDIIREAKKHGLI